ncbi:SRPN8 [Trypoxylus dichotomus]
MYKKYSYLCSILIYFSILSRVHTQSVEDIRQLSASLDQFSLEFLAKTSQQIGDSENLALSPYTIWSLLNIIREGAQGNTAVELEKALSIPVNQERSQFRRSYQALGNYLTKKNNAEVTLETTNSIFTAADQQLKPNYLQIVESFYQAEILPVDFRNTNEAVNIINNHVNNATRGRIPDFIKEGDIQNAEVFISTVLFFKGAWVNQFNTSATTRDAFYDDSGKQIGEVDMMNTFGIYPFIMTLDNTAIAVELAYKGNMSMVAILPRKGYTLQSVLDSLTKQPFSTILDALEKSLIDFSDDPVYVSIPKFSITSDLTINTILYQMGIRDLFDADRANLLEMFSHYLYVSRVLQRAEIQVDEEGTVASAAAGGNIQNKIRPPKFLANKPFAYFIVDKISRAIIFGGKFSKP